MLSIVHGKLSSQEDNDFRNNVYFVKFNLIFIYRWNLNLQINCIVSFTPLYKSKYPRNHFSRIHLQQYKRYENTLVNNK